MKKIVWGITGAGDLLEEIIDELQQLSDAKKVELTTCLSKSADFVLRWYKLTDKVTKISKKVLVEKDANTPFIAGPLQIGKYHSMLVAPATANSVAKIVHGIADTLITNAVAQAQKGEIPVIILPVDLRPGKRFTQLPTGEKKVIVMRDIDVENAKRLRGMSGITLIETPKEIAKFYG